MRAAALVLVLLLPALLSAQERHSLIIALSDYWKHGHHWNDVNARNDAVLLTTALKSADFRDGNIHLVTDAQTKEDIFRAIEQRILKRVAKGDMVHIHYSGHGQQVADYDGDEVDGYDEALVPLAAPSRPRYRNRSGVEVDYGGEAHLTDDELSEILGRVRKKLGKNGSLLVTIDACHSGTATRGMAVARGSSIKIAPEGFVPPIKYMNDNSWMPVENALELAPMVAIFASSSQELNYEMTADDGKNYGPLSFALASAIGAGYLEKGYDALFGRVRQVMAEKAPAQSPFAEGLGNVGVFDNLSKYRHWITDWQSSDVFRIGSGFLSGLTVGSIVEGTTPEGRNWTARIIETTATSAKARVEGGRSPAKNGTSSVRVLLPNFKGTRSLCFDVYRMDDLSALRLATANFDEVGDKCSFRLSLHENRLLLTNRFGKTLLDRVPERDARGQLSGGLLDELRVILGKSAYVEMLRELSAASDRVSGMLEIYLLQPKDGKENPTAPDDFSDRRLLSSTGQDAKVAAGSHVEFRITNRGARPFYYTLVDITPDDDVAFLFPAKGRAPDEYHLEPGQSNEHSRQFFKISPPYGTETMKLILSERFIQWDSGQHRGIEEGDDFENSILEMVKGAERGGPKTIGSDIAISTYRYRIVKRGQSN